MSTNSATDRFFAALNAHDLQALRDSLAQDFVFEEVAGPGEPSIDALSSELSAIYLGLPDVTFRPVRQAHEGGRTYVEFRAIGTHSAPFMGIASTGTLAIVSGVFNFDVNDTIRRLRMTVDFGGLRRQLLMASRPGTPG